MYLYIYIEKAAYTVYKYQYLYTYILYMLPFQTENETKNPFTIGSPCKWKFVVCPFGCEDTNESYQFANGLNGRNRLNGKQKSGDL
jgi:hypothetical protein